MLWEGKSSMSDQSKNRNEDPWDREAPGKRLEKKTKPVLTPAQAQKQKEKRIMIIMIAAAVVMVIATVLVLLYRRWVQKPTLPPGPSQSIGPISTDPLLSPDPEETLSFDAVQPKVGGERKSEDIYTILIFGTDTTSGLTDTMMVATYDVTNQQATVMSLPRDTLINSSARPGIAAKKLNAVYKVYGNGEKGTEALKNEVSELVGFVPDYYVQIDWELVGEMVDAIGGIWFDNPYHMEYFDPYQDLMIYQEQGYRKLSGSDAMQIVRWRHNNPGVPYNPGVSRATVASDLERLNVQHAFLKSVLEQTLQIGNITRVGQLIDLFNSRVDSDLNVENMFWFAKSAVVGGLRVDDVEFCTMPTALGSYGGADFVYPVQSQLLPLINEKLNPYVEQVTIRQLDLMSPTADGGLRSSTGRLAEPSLAYPPVVETDPPEESDPVESGEPGESDPLESGEPSASAPLASGEPVGSNPPESGTPTGSDPVESEPGNSGPDPAQVSDPPPETQPAGPEISAAPVSDPKPVDPSPEPGGADAGQDAIDWGSTPD